MEYLETTDIRKSSAKISGLLDGMKSPPNTKQFSIALAASRLIATVPRQMWHIPPGQGKSRVVASIALILLESKTNVKTIHILHCNELLKRKD